MTDSYFKELELFNAHQEDTRKRTEFMAKSVFLNAGTALTLSINMFIGKDAPKVDASALCLIRWGWGALFASIIGYLAVVGTMMIRDYRFGERWRNQLNGKSVDVSGNSGWLEWLMWVFGVVSVLALVAGLGLLAWVSSSLLGISAR